MAHVVLLVKSCMMVNYVVFYYFQDYPHGIHLPRVGSGVVRIDPLRFLAGCRKRRLNQV